ncbi:MAG: KamA family radical SAM protein [Desulfosalsimonadaceae bacterium]|nr:KamA family radical SAM protein [Desulfosalsimonadaceae bacterium]
MPDIEISTIIISTIDTSINDAQSWQRLLANSIVTPEALSAILPVDPEVVRRVTQKYPMRINPYFLSLISEKNSPLWRQCVPDIQELDHDVALEPDPLWEEPQSPVANLIHRYPDRVLFMVSSQCAMYCRHCMRKRRVGAHGHISENDLDRGIAYIRSQPGLKEVILSGGDPLLLADDRIERLLAQLHQIPHVDMIRIHTRTPCTLPQRITDDLVAVFRRFAPLYINIQFNHPDEITQAAATACESLADAGIPLGSQTVLLKGVNDDPEVMMRLMQKLLKIRVRPYYLHHADPIEGTRHFRTSLETGKRIMAHLRGRMSGMGVPHYMIDLPQGGGKVPILPDYIKPDHNKKDAPGKLMVKNFEGNIFTYPAG